MHANPFFSKYTRIFAVLMTFVMVLYLLPFEALADEIPEAVYYGDDNASAVLSNLDYLDVKDSNTWAKEAIYLSGALGILKGYGNKQFGRTHTLSKEEAIAIAYRAAGREADAQQAAEALNNTRLGNSENPDALRMWSDGYLQLAANEGLISFQDLNDAFSDEQAALDPDSFKRKAPAERQEMAFWVAKVLGLQPVYEQQEVFNNYNDWEDADPDKIPYIEAILEKNIMNGDGRGNFKPRQPITREQAAQVVKNAEPFILPIFGLKKQVGTIEYLTDSLEYSDGIEIKKTVFDVRSSNGKLHKIIAERPESIYVNEQTGHFVSGLEKDFVVYKKGRIGDSSLLEEGDRIEYIVDSNNTIRYIKATPGTKPLRYVAAQIKDIDTENQLLDVYQFFELDSPDLGTAGENISLNMEGQNVNAVYYFSNNVSVVVDGIKSDIQKLGAHSNVILTIQNNNVVVGIKTVDLGINPKEKYIVKGIVEDNNPQLGYITLYNEDGTGSSPDSWEELAMFRTYNYTDPTSIEVFKNHKVASIDDIGAGDTVFIKLDREGNVVSISGVDNYTVKYARVITKRPSTLAVEYDDGVQQVLNVDENVLLIKNGRLARYSSLKDGDRVKLILHITNKFTKIKEITIEESGRLISSLFKGVISYVDKMSDKVVVLNLQKLERGKWVRSQQKGFTDIHISEDCSLYFGDRRITADTVNKYLRGNEAYIAVMQDYGERETAVLLSFRNEEDAEVLYDDRILSPNPGSGMFSLSREYREINLDRGSIIVKDGRLVSPSSISNEDTAYVVANRSYNSGEYNAGIVEISERSNNDLIQIYRGRISSIKENSNFTVESFSRLEGMRWRYYNTPKTFQLTYNTRIVSDNGLVNQRNFTDYSEQDYIGRTIYIVTDKDGMNAVLISTAPYGIYNVKGEIYSVGEASTEEGDEEPMQINLRDARVYDLEDYVWVEADNMTIDILNSSIILKGSRVIKPSELRKGDIVRIVKKDDSTSGEGYIILVEE